MQLQKNTEETQLYLSDLTFRKICWEKVIVRVKVDFKGKGKSHVKLKRELFDLFCFVLTIANGIYGPWISHAPQPCEGQAILANKSPKNLLPNVSRLPTSGTLHLWTDHLQPSSRQHGSF